jgi:D-alanyl-lipoteichoic acid acyltransferase DltB (MBOAT superfamily)
LPQIKVKRNFDFDKAKQGVYQIIWGLVKKIVIADSCAVYANQIFDHYQTMNSLSLILGAVYFAFQIYGDFSGYSDIALGTSKLFGIDLLKNFDFPYFSRDIAEFWRKWHISLSSWFKDYVYIPLGGSSGSLRLKIRNTFIIFLISGFWHGANWTYVAWGFVNALYFLPLLVLKQNRKNIDSIELKFNFNALKNIFKILFTFAITCFAWIFFRSKTLTDAFLYIQKMVSNWEFKEQYFAIERYNNELVYLLLLFIVVEWNFKGKIEPISGNYSWLKLTLCIAAIIALGIFSDSKEFIYFQF